MDRSAGHSAPQAGRPQGATGCAGLSQFAQSCYSTRVWVCGGSLMRQSSSMLDWVSILGRDYSLWLAGSVSIGVGSRCAHSVSCVAHACVMCGSRTPLCASCDGACPNCCCVAAFDECSAQGSPWPSRRRMCAALGFWRLSWLLPSRLVPWAPGFRTACTLRR